MRDKRYFCICLIFFLYVVLSLYLAFTFYTILTELLVKLDDLSKINTALVAHLTSLDLEVLKLKQLLLLKSKFGGISVSGDTLLFATKLLFTGGKFLWAWYFRKEYTSGNGGSGSGGNEEESGNPHSDKDSGSGGNEAESGSHHSDKGSDSDVDDNDADDADLWFDFYKWIWDNREKVSFDKNGTDEDDANLFNQWLNRDKDCDSKDLGNDKSVDD